MSDHTLPERLLQPLPIPTHPWTAISMDFIEDLPSICGKDSIMVVDRFTKYAHFLPLTHPHTTETVAKVFFEQIIRLYDIPSSVVWDRDRTFTSTFCRDLFPMQGISFNFSSSYLPQTDGQTEVTNRTLKQYLRCFSSERPREWTKWVTWAEFCNNTSFHTAIRMSPFQALYGIPRPTLLSYLPGTAKL